MIRDEIKTELHEVVGYYLFQPIATLLEQLDNARPEIPHFHSVVFLESSYSTAVIPLVTTLIDSFVNWSSYLLNKGKPNKHAVDYIKNDYKNFDLANKLDEVYCVRDAIVHAHLWRREINVTITRDIDYGDFNLHEGYGEIPRFQRVVDVYTAKTKILGLSVVPTRINKTEIQMILDVLLEVIKILEKKVINNRQENNLINISGQYVVYQGKTILFIDLLEKFCGLTSDSEVVGEQ